MECSTISIKINGKNHTVYPECDVETLRLRSPRELAQALKGTKSGGTGARQTERLSGLDVQRMIRPTQRHGRGTEPYLNPS